MRTFYSLAYGWGTAVVLQYVVLAITSNLNDAPPASFFPLFDLAYVAQDGDIAGSEWLWLLSIGLAPFTVAISYWVYGKIRHTWGEGNPEEKA